ncbi:MAG: hypothetical protein JNN04_00330 [Cyclobacteriaceae bacterium]|nr:hypothetical protein [Cyclobacteriaceae bacterium]
MKKIMKWTAVIMWAVISVHAQDQQPYQAQAENYFLMRDGRVYQIRNQEQAQLMEQLRLQNGTMVNPDGSYQDKNQKRQVLKNGQCLDMEGNRYKSQEEFRKQMQYRNQAMSQEHLMMQNGQMFRMQNQQQTRLQERVTLQNGTTVDPDGQVQLKNKEQLRLRDGECLDMEGNRYQTQERFREKMQQRMEKKDKEKMNQGEKKGKSEKKGKKN